MNSLNINNSTVGHRYAEGEVVETSSTTGAITDKSAISSRHHRSTRTKEALAKESVAVTKSSSTATKTKRYARRFDMMGKLTNPRPEDLDEDGEILSHLHKKRRPITSPSYQEPAVKKSRKDDAAAELIPSRIKGNESTEIQNHREYPLGHMALFGEFDEITEAWIKKIGSEDHESDFGYACVHNVAQEEAMDFGQAVLGSTIPVIESEKHKEDLVMRRQEGVGSAILDRQIQKDTDDLGHPSGPNHYDTFDRDAATEGSDPGHNIYSPIQYHSVQEFHNIRAGPQRGTLIGTSGQLSDEYDEFESYQVRRNRQNGARSGTHGYGTHGYPNAFLQEALEVNSAQQQGPRSASQEVACSGTYKQNISDPFLEESRDLDVAGWGDAPSGSHGRPSKRPVQDETCQVRSRRPVDVHSNTSSYSRRVEAQQPHTQYGSSREIATRADDESEYDNEFNTMGCAGNYIDDSFTAFHTPRTTSNGRTGDSTHIHNSNRTSIKPLSNQYRLESGQAQGGNELTDSRTFYSQQTGDEGLADFLRWNPTTGYSMPNTSSKRIISTDHYPYNDRDDSNSFSPHANQNSTPQTPPLVASMTDFAAGFYGTPPLVEPVFPAEMISVVSSRGSITEETSQTPKVPLPQIPGVDGADGSSPSDRLFMGRYESLSRDTVAIAMEAVSTYTSEEAQVDEISGGEKSSEGKVGKMHGKEKNLDEVQEKLDG